MATLGIMQTSFRHEKRYMRELARAGTTCGFMVFRFQPSGHLRSTLQGLHYDHGHDRWRKATFEVPNFIYDRCFHTAPTEQSLTFIKELKQYSNTVFLGYGLPGKWAVHSVLKNDSDLNEHLPLTFQLNHRTAMKVIRSLLDEKAELLLKPITGSQGNGLVHITQRDDVFHLIINHKGDIHRHNYDTTRSFHTFIENLLSKKEYMAQEMLHLRDQNGRPFDRRVVMKKQADLWKELGRGTRVGLPHSFVSNLHSGGVIKPYADLGLSKDLLARADEKISELSLRAARLLELHFPPKFELGLDFGIDQTGHVWLLEANSKPGHSILQNKQDLHLLPFQYCRYLQSQKKGVNK
ncbi:YheC/YheD family endospore coat-associated protein [Alkalihalobacillus sp. CinArs1]|uniref:YheC/YheD family endospore coat-associated protein n=1 Tax=Alkalihalobacillus sp. CinArs1 TaxID=2995314 RepID=UPI0022DE16D0|nr:YheC/YheD family protein [Alkalihalobacillus sp. CinArs1]